jgi:phosphoglycerate dehydrogenase-like enzyme
MLRCAVLDDYQKIALSMADWGALAGAVDVQVFSEHIADRSALARALAGFEIVVAMRERTAFDRSLLEQLGALRLLVTTGMRNASIDLAVAADRNVTVCGTRGHPGTAAELTWALILGLMRNLPRETEEFRRGGPWQTGIGHSLRDATLGVIGLGHVGKLVAAVGRTFEMKVVGWSRSATPERCVALDIGHAATLSDLLRAADVATLHVTLNAQTRDLIGAAELAAMKRTAFLVNTSRGPVVNEAALITALREGRIAGAAADVFDQEPLPVDHPLRRLPNLLGTPHVGYVTRENYRVFYGDAVEDIQAWLAGKPVRVLNIEVR